MEEKVGCGPVDRAGAKRKGLGVRHYAKLSYTELATEEQVAQFAIDSEDPEIEPLALSDLRGRHRYLPASGAEIENTLICTARVEPR